MLLNILLYPILALFIFRFLRFISTPLLRSVGFYRYYSPLLMAIPILPGIRDIHLGTSWNHLRLRKKLNQRLVMQYLMVGLLRICDEVEAGRVSPDLLLRGSTHFMSEKSLLRFGCKVRSLNWYEWLLFLQNYPELCLLQSITYGRFSLVSFRHTKTMTVSAGELLANRQEVLRALALVSRRKVRQSARPVFV